MQKERIIMLTEKEAWLKIAEWFKKDRTDNQFIIIEDLEEACCGICKATTILCRNNFISEQMWRDMRAKITYVKPKYTIGGYYWPENSTGDKQRIKFCLERAAEL
jgi:hypothetical protein